MKIMKLKTKASVAVNQRGVRLVCGDVNGACVLASDYNNFIAAIFYKSPRSHGDVKFYNVGRDQTMKNDAEAFVNSYNRRAAAKKQKDADTKDMKTFFVVGDIVVYSYGYDATLYEFWQIVDVLPSGKSVRIRRINAADVTPAGYRRGADGGVIVPMKDSFHERETDVLLKRVKPGTYYGNYLSHESGIMTKWDGKAKEWSNNH